MKTTTLFAAAILTLSLPAVAQRPHGDRDRGYPNGPNPGQMRQVADLANRLDRTTTMVYDQAARSNRRPDRGEVRALENLRNLAAEADQFRLAVGNRRQGPRRGQEAFEDLSRAYDRAARSFDRVESRRWVDRGMTQVSELMSELSRYYSYRDFRSWDRYRDDRGH
jgi:hypothetical protein